MGVLVYPFGVDNVDCSLMNNQFMSVYLHYLGRTDDKEIVDEEIQTEFRCTIHSCLGSQQDLYQELQHKFCILKKEKFLSGFKKFLPLSLLFRTPFYLFPDPKNKKNKKQNNDNDDDDDDKEQETTKRNMVILKTELWIFPPLDWKKTKTAPKSPIYIDLLDDDSDDNEEQNQMTETTTTTNSTIKVVNTMPSLEQDISAIPCLEKEGENVQNINAVVIDIDDDDDDNEDDDVQVVDNQNDDDNNDNDNDQQIDVTISEI